MLSERALIVLSAIPASVAQHGIRPQRIISAAGPPEATSYLMARRDCRGPAFQRAGATGMGADGTSPNWRAISWVSLCCAPRPQMIQAPIKQGRGERYSSPPLFCEEQNDYYELRLF